MAGVKQHQTALEARAEQSGSHLDGLASGLQRVVEMSRRAHLLGAYGDLRGTVIGDWRKQLTGVLPGGAGLARVRREASSGKESAPISSG